MEALTPVQIINDHLDALPVEPYPDAFWRASSAGYCMRRVFLQRKQIEPTAPLDARTRRVFAVGDIFHAWVQQIMKKHYGEELTHEEADVEIPELNVKGHADNILKLNGQWTLVDYKSQHSGAFHWARKEKNSMMKPHQRLQMGTYLYGLQEKFPGINGLMVFISKDDLTMEQVPLFWSEQLKADVEAYWGSLNKWWERGELPDCTCEWELKYCPYHENGKCCGDHLYQVMTEVLV